MLHIIVSDPKATKLKKKNQDMKNFRKKTKNSTAVRFIKQNIEKWKKKLNIQSESHPPKLKTAVKFVMKRLEKNKKEIIK